MPVEHILSYGQAAAVIAEHASAIQVGTPAVRVPLQAASRRVLAEDIRTSRALPPFDRATRDGFAVRAADLARETPAWLRVIGLLRAGMPPLITPLAQGEALEIMTGAPMPPGSDSVLMVEHAERRGDQIRAVADRTLNAGDNVVSRGNEAQPDAIIIPTGTRLAAAQVAAAASCGAAELLVYARPQVAIFATGDELVEPGQPILDHQIYNSNAYSLAAQVDQAGAEPDIRPVLRDDLAATEHAIATAQAAVCLDKAPLLLFAGGVSMGKFDYVETALRNRGAEFFFTGVRIQPGKPVVFGALPLTGGGRQYFFGLPGNPVSTLVTFSLFARPLLAALSGESRYAIPFVAATLTVDVAGKPGLTRFLPAQVHHHIAGATVNIVPWQGSGDLAALAVSNAFLVIPPERDLFRAGEIMTVLLR